ncbi:MAG: class I SAM-dependent methyltransferase [Bacteroidetes bacterium]|nr:class I SAM-dependent methyltransferase [Bacteroidota bacterium]
MKCPLCKHDKFFIVRKYDFKILEQQWIKTFSYNPFVNFDTNQKLQKLKCRHCDLIFYNPGFFGDTDFYEKISNNNWYYEENKWEFDRAIELISQHTPNSLLEIGSGDGGFLEKVSTAVEYSEGLEINKAAIEKCRSKKLNVSSKKLTEVEKKFEMIASFEVFEHLDDVSYFVTNSISKLSSNGLLLIAVPNPDGYFKELDTVLLDLPPHHNLGFSKRTFEFIAKKYDLKMIEYDLEPLRYVHYQLYMNSIIGYNTSLFGNGIKIKLIKKMKSLIFNFFSPLFFVSDRNHIKGQTHLVVFQKN